MLIALLAVVAAARDRGSKSKLSPTPAATKLSPTPAATIDKHVDGLWPHHDAGRDPSDPLLFKHRYQHHDAETDQLVYFQYEAKRHAHVVMLDAVGVASCVVSPLSSNRTDLALMLLTAPPPLRNGSIVVSKAALCVTPDGTQQLEYLQQRLISEPSVQYDPAAAAVFVRALSVEASLHELFEHSTLEVRARP